MTSDRRDQLAESLGDREYRDAVVAEFINEGLAFQIHETREMRGWTQAELGQRAGMAQESISLLENPNYGRFTLKTLKRLASAFDVALIVRFVPFSTLVDWAANLSSQDLAVVGFNDDKPIQDVVFQLPSRSTSEASPLHGGTDPTIFSSIVPIIFGPLTDQETARGIDCLPAQTTAFGGASTVATAPTSGAGNLQIESRR